MLGLARQMIAELFFVLLFLILFSKRLSSRNSKILFMIFGFCLIVSHYSLAIIFAFFVTLIWLLGYFAKRTNSHISLSMVVFFLALMFSWFLYTASSATMISVSGKLSWIIGGFSDFFNPTLRGTTVLVGIGASVAPSPLYSVSRAIALATEFFILIGFLVLLLKKKKGFDFEYFVPCLGSIIILALCILLPNFASTLGATRFYSIALFFAAPLFAIGCIALFRFAAKLLGFAAKKKTEIYSLILMTLLLGSYFLFQTSFIYEVTDSESWSLPLSRYRLGERLYSDFWYITESQVSSAEWLSQEVPKSNWAVYSDMSVSVNLIGYGGIDPNNIYLIQSKPSLQNDQFIYLAELNTVYDKFTYNGLLYNASDIIASQSYSSIYNNGFCEILR
jgi:uncharacterized membrane protein